METEGAIALTRRLAADLGCASTPRILAERSHLVLALDPHPIAARVAIATSTTRVGLDWLAREVAIARHLDAQGVPVTRPSRALAPGPHAIEGLIVSFWELEERTEDCDPAIAGARLAQVHRALVGFDASTLPRWGVMEEARAVLPRACEGGLLEPGEVRHLREAWAHADGILAGSEARTASMQPVHGDAHFGNVFGTTRGPLWTDWEDACVAPVEWDLATLSARNRMFGEESALLGPALAAYGGDADPGLITDLVALRNLQVIPWLVVFAERQPELLERARMRLAKARV